MDIDTVNNTINHMWPYLNERQRRILAATQAKALGHGGVTIVSRICGLSRVTITKGLNELEEEPQEINRIRMPGSGRPTLVSLNPELMSCLTELLESTTRGDPESPLLWTCLSTRTIANQLIKQGYSIGYRKVAGILNDLGYSLQSNSKVDEGKQHEDRDEQFKFINKEVKKALKEGQPVISVDTKKKELIGNYKNPGRLLRPKKSPLKVNVHDFPDPLVNKAIPYGIYDIGCNSGFVNVGTDHDTATFAVASIRGWWKKIGEKIYKPTFKYLLITADGGGSNGYRIKLWKYELQKLANEIGVPIKVCHFPPGTSKWNRVEHRLFSFITSNWKGQPLRDYETVVKLISHTYTKEGLKVTCRLDRRRYNIGIKINDEQLQTIFTKPNKFHGEWNYTIINQ